MSSVISNLTIQDLQIAAALLMGYDYFLSPHLKLKADAAATAYLQAQHVLSAKQLSLANPEANQMRGLVAALVLFATASAVSMLVAWALFRVQRSPWVTLVTSLIALFFIAGTLQGSQSSSAYLLGRAQHPRSSCRSRSFCCSVRGA